MIRNVIINSKDTGIFVFFFSHHLLLFVGPCRDHPRRQKLCAIVQKKGLCKKLTRKERRVCPVTCGLCIGLFIASLPVHSFCTDNQLMCKHAVLGKHQLYGLPVQNRVCSYCCCCGARCSSMIERLLMLRWVDRLILHGGPIELFLIPASAV